MCPDRPARPGGFLIEKHRGDGWESIDHFGWGIIFAGRFLQYVHQAHVPSKRIGRNHV